MKIERNAEPIGKIEQFFQEYYKVKEWDRLGYTITAGIVAFIHVICAAAALEELSSGNSVLLFLAFTSGFAAITWYMIPFSNFKENEQMHSFYERLKYLPVDWQAWKRWKAEKLFHYTKKMFLVSLAVTVIIGLLTKSLSVTGILFTVAVSFLFPMMIGLLEIYLRR